MALTSNRLRELRENIRLTQAEVGKILDISHSTVSNHESGDRGLTQELIRKYAALYKVDTHELFFDPEKQFVPADEVEVIESVA